MKPTEMPVQSRRQRWMSILARADRDSLEAVCRPLEEIAHAQWQWLRPPETGLVMVRGRIGGSGAKFNLGEVPVTRCAVRLQLDNGGSVGVAWVQGRDARHAELAARVDALLQTPERHDLIHAQVIEPLTAAQARRNATTARKAAATKVEFYTMAREARTVAKS